MTDLMTVAEMAKYYRTTTTTIYRWLKQGKLKSIKIGKEWRICRSSLEVNDPLSGTSDSLSSDRIWDSLNKNEHLLAIVQSEKDVFQLELSFFKYALQKGQPMLKGCWWQDPDEVRDVFQRGGLDVKSLEKKGVFHIHDFTSSYNRDGIQGPVSIWNEAISDNRADSIWISGSPHLKCCGDEEDLIQFEALLHDTIRELPVIGMCPYYFDNFASESFECIIPLMDHHSGILFYNDSRARILRVS